MTWRRVAGGESDREREREREAGADGASARAGAAEGSASTSTTCNTDRAHVSRRPYSCALHVQARPCALQAATRATVAACKLQRARRRMRPAPFPCQAGRAARTPSPAAAAASSRAAGARRRRSPPLCSPGTGSRARRGAGRAPQSCCRRRGGAGTRRRSRPRCGRVAEHRGCCAAGMWRVRLCDTEGVCVTRWRARCCCNHCWCTEPVDAPAWAAAAWLLLQPQRCAHRCRSLTEFARS